MSRMFLLVIFPELGCILGAACLKTSASRVSNWLLVPLSAEVLETGFPVALWIDYPPAKEKKCSTTSIFRMEGSRHGGRHAWRGAREVRLKRTSEMEGGGRLKRTSENSDTLKTFDSLDSANWGEGLGLSYAAKGGTSSSQKEQGGGELDLQTYGNELTLYFHKSGNEISLDV